MTGIANARIAEVLKAVLVGKPNPMTEDERFAMSKAGLIATKTMTVNEVTKMKPRDPRRFIRVTAAGREAIKAAA